MASNKNINITYDFTPLDTLNPTKDWKRFTRDLLSHAAFMTDESGTTIAHTDCQSNRIVTEQ